MMCEEPRTSPLLKIRSPSRMSRPAGLRFSSGATGFVIMITRPVVPATNTVAVSSTRTQASSRLVVPTTLGKMPPVMISRHGSTSFRKILSSSSVSSSLAATVPHTLRSRGLPGDARAVAPEQTAYPFMADVSVSASLLG